MKYNIITGAILIFCCTIWSCQKKSIPQNTVIEDTLWAVNGSAEGKYMAVGGVFDVLKIFSEKNFKTKKSYPLKNTITQLAWHPTDNLLAIAIQGEDAAISLLDVSTDKFTRLSHMPEYGGRGIAWNHDGTLLAVGDNAAELTIFRKDGTFVRKISTSLKAITGLSWHPSENKLVMVGAHIEIYDVDADVKQQIIPRPVEVLMLCVAWHPSGDFFVTGDYGDYIENYPALLQFWTPNGEKIREIEKSKAEYRNLKWSDDGERLATASEALRIWSKDGNLLHEGKSEDLLWGIDWTANNTEIVTSTNKGKILIWNNEAKLIKQKIF